MAKFLQNMDGVMAYTIQTPNVKDVLKSYHTLLVNKHSIDKLNSKMYVYKFDSLLTEKRKYDAL
jgi:hypothetical protein